MESFSGTFAVKNLLIKNLETGNLVLDLILGTVVCGLITSLFSLFDYNKVYNYIKIFFNFEKKYKASIFLEYKKRNLSDSFKGILYYIDINNIKKITNVREEQEIKYNRDDVACAHLLYLPIEDESYEIKKDLFIIFGKREKKIEGGRYEIYEDLTNMTIYSNVLSIKDLQDFLNECKDTYVEYMDSTLLSKQTLFNCCYNTSGKTLDVNKIDFKTNRRFNNLFFDQKDDLLKKVNNFIAGREWYNERGIPYTLGILLHGEPGCGKTSFIKALLKHIDANNKDVRTHGIYVNLHDAFDFDQLENIISKSRLGEWNVPLSQRLYIFEDIDCMGDVVKDRDLVKKETALYNKKVNKYISKLKDKKELSEKSDSESDSDSEFNSNSNSNSSSIEIGPRLKNIKDNKNSLSRLLNILDGIIETPGRIMIMTTNKKEIIDKALLRGGRIDIQINFTKCSKTMAKDIINKFYTCQLELEAFTKFKEFELTPAELIQQCFSYDDYNELLQSLIL